MDAETRLLSQRCTLAGYLYTLPGRSRTRDWCNRFLAYAARIRNYLIDQRSDPSHERYKY